MDRREYLKILGVGAVGVAIPGCAPEAPPEPAKGPVDPEGTFENYRHRFLTDAEMETVRTLADIIIPADEFSGSASDANVAEFIDFTAWDQEEIQVPLRGGLAWLDAACRKASGVRFVECSAEAQTAMLDRIAWPDVAAPDDSQGVAFFTMMRDLTASGFYSSQEGVRDLRYMGNVGVAEWNGGRPA